MHSIKEAEYFKAVSRIEIPELKNDAATILKTATIGVWNTLTRPYFGEVKNGMMLLSAIENIIVLTFLEHDVRRKLIVAKLLQFYICNVVVNI